MEKRNHFIFIALILIVGLVLSACGSSDGTGNKSKSSDASNSGSNEKTFNMIETAEIPTGDPALGTDSASFNVLGQTIEGLYVLNKDDKPVPAISDGKPDISDDGKKYTFHLRDDAEWSNGDPVTADDFVYAWQRAVKPDTGSSYAYMFEDIIKNAKEISNGDKQPDTLGVKAKDDHTLKVTLVHPVEYFDSLLAFGTYLPLNKKFVEDKGDEFGTKSDNMLANGPFILKDWDGTSDEWNFEKNDHYYDKDNVDLDKVHVQVAKDVSTAINLYNTDKVDRTGKLTSEFARQYKDNDDVTKFKEGSTWFLKFNQERDGKDTPLANKNIRKAIAMGYERKKFTDDVLANGSVPIGGIIPEGLAENPKTGEDFRKESGNLMSKDLDKAKKYWKKGLKELGKDHLTLEYLTDDDDDAKRQGEFFQNQLEENLDGLKIKLKNVPLKVRIEDSKAQNYDIVMMGWGPDYLDPMTFLDLFITDGTANETGYSSDEYDKLIDDAKVKYAGDPEKRWDAMLKAEKRIVQKDTIVAPIYQRGRVVLKQPYVKGFTEHLFGVDYTLKDVTIDGKN